MKGLVSSHKLSLTGSISSGSFNYSSHIQLTGSSARGFGHHSSLERLEMKFLFPIFSVVQVRYELLKETLELASEFRTLLQSKLFLVCWHLGTEKLVQHIQTTESATVLEKPRERERQEEETLKLSSSTSLLLKLRGNGVG